MNILLKQSIKSYKFTYLKDKSDIKYELFYNNGHKYLKKIENAVCEMDYGGKIYGRILFDIITNKVFYIDDLSNNKINVYNNYENLKAKRCDEIIELPYKISGTYSIIHKGFFHFFKLENKNTNILIKYDLKEKKILLEKQILPDADLENNTNCWGGYNDIILISDKNNLYEIYA